MTSLSVLPACADLQFPSRRPDVLTLLGGVFGGQTQQMKGKIPAPEVNGMVPLAAIGRASSFASAPVRP